MILFDAVTKTFPAAGNTVSVAVKNFSLTIPSQTTVCFVGSSGCGKTTLLRMVNRMVDPTSGAIFIDDLNVMDADPVQLRRSIGYVLQNGGLFPHRTIEDNVAEVLVLNGAKRSDARRQVPELLERVGLDANLRRRYPAQLSGGQQQRVGVARAIATDPNILLMDEPFGAVDPIVRRELQDELIQMKQELGKTTIFITHDVQEALRIGDYVVVLEKGAEIAQKGTPAEVAGNPKSEFVRKFLGTSASERPLHVRDVDGQQIAYDEYGVPVGNIGSVTPGIGGEPS